MLTHLYTDNKKILESVIYSDGEHYALNPDYSNFHRLNIKPGSEVNFRLNETIIYTTTETDLKEKQDKYIFNVFRKRQMQNSYPPASFNKKSIATFMIRNAYGFDPTILMDDHIPVYVTCKHIVNAVDFVHFTNDEIIGRLGSYQQASIKNHIDVTARLFWNNQSKSINPLLNPANFKHAQIIVIEYTDSNDIERKALYRINIDTKH